MKSILEEHLQACFRILNIFDEEKLLSCNRTSFVWSKYPKTLCLATNKHYFDLAINNPNISGIIVFPQAVRHIPDNKKIGIVVTEKAPELFYYLHNKAIHAPEPNKETTTTNQKYRNCNFIAPSASIDPTVILGDNIWIGDNVVIHPGCIILDKCTIRRNSVLHPYVTVGTEGFFSKHILGDKVHIHHFGGVNIGENCHIHTGTNISRSVNYNEDTIISDKVHIGIHSNIGHDCNIGKNCDISAKVLLAGRVKIGKNCWIGASVSIANAITVGDDCRIIIGSVVISDIPDHTTVSGNFALNHTDNLRNYLQKKRQ